MAVSPAVLSRSSCRQTWRAASSRVAGARFSTPRSRRCRHLVAPARSLVQPARASGVRLRGRSLDLPRPRSTEPADVDERVAALLCLVGAPSVVHHDLEERRTAPRWSRRLGLLRCAHRRCRARTCSSTVLRSRLSKTVPASILRLHPGSALVRRRRESRRLARPRPGRPAEPGCRLAQARQRDHHRGHVPSACPTL